MTSRHFFATYSKFFVLFSFKSRRVLFCQLLCSVKKREKYCACLTAEKQKNRGWCSLIDRSNPCFSGIFLY